MRNTVLAALAILGVVIGSLTLTNAANAVYAPTGHGKFVWVENN